MLLSMCMPHNNHRNASSTRSFTHKIYVIYKYWCHTRNWLFKYSDLIRALYFSWISDTLERSKKKLQYRHFNQNAINNYTLTLLNRTISNQSNSKKGGHQYVNISNGKPVSIPYCTLTTHYLVCVIFMMCILLLFDGIARALKAVWCHKILNTGYCMIVLFSPPIGAIRIDRWLFLSKNLFLLWMGFHSPVTRDSYISQKTWETNNSMDSCLVSPSRLPYSTTTTTTKNQHKGKCNICIAIFSLAEWTGESEKSHQFVCTNLSFNEFGKLTIRVFSRKSTRLYTV